MDIHVGKRTSAEGWISFETDPHLTLTRRRIYQRCAPCLENLLAQLEAGVAVVDLGPAWSCWKIAVILPDLDSCWQFLELFSTRHPEEYVYGKFGTGQKERPTRAVVFHADTKERVDELLPKVQECAVSMGGPVQVSRACANPYGELFGPWPEWRPQMPVRYPKRVPAAVRHLRYVLYDRS